MEILFEDKEIIVCVKNAGQPVQSDKSRDLDVVNYLRNYLTKSKHGMTKINGIPYVGLVHRLDRPVGGVMVFAKTPYALKDLNKQIQNKKISKSYLAITMIHQEKKLQEIIHKKNERIRHNSIYDDIAMTPWIKQKDYLVKNSRDNISYITHNKDDKDAKLAELDYRILDIKDREIEKDIINTCMIEVYLITGRHHQIRVQMSELGLPLVGDKKYNNFYKEVDKNNKEIESNRCIALYSYRLEFTHPKTKKKLEFICEPKQGWFE